MSGAPTHPNPRRVGFISDPLMVLHNTGERHPERPDRLRAIHRALRHAGLLTSPDPFPNFRIDLTDGGKWPFPVPDATVMHPTVTHPVVELPYRIATDIELQLCHPITHIDKIRDECLRGEPGDESAGVTSVLDTGDTPVSGRSEEMARRSVGAAISAVDAVMDGTVDRCFVASRPPGHHAESTRAMGFCLYCNAAIAARYAVRYRGLSRVAIVDFDVHHGNGTQQCLEADPTVLFISIHQHPQTCYPGTGFEWEIGVRTGRGFTLNVPLPPASGDAAYLQAFQTKILPKLYAYKPELLILSAGFDAHIADPLADMELTDTGYHQLTHLLRTAAQDLSQGKLVSLLEGGYNLPALGRCVTAHIQALTP